MAEENKELKDNEHVPQEVKDNEQVKKDDEQVQQETKDSDEVHYAVEEYEVQDYSAIATQYAVPKGYYNDDGEFIEEPDQPAAYDYSDYSQYYQGGYEYSGAEGGADYNYDAYYAQYYDPSAYANSSSAPPPVATPVVPVSNLPPPAAQNIVPTSVPVINNPNPTSISHTPHYYPNLTLNNKVPKPPTTITATPIQMIKPITSIAPLNPAASYTPRETTPRYTPTNPTPITAPGTKIYYPSQSNPNNPVGPIIITKSGYAGPNATTHTPSTEPQSEKKKKKKASSVVRAAGGELWEDKTLEDWEDNDYRLFAGDLGNEVTEELLFKTFSKYPSLVRTRVVRDSRTMKTKGYGFISFKDPDDFVRAWREMNGKYVGNRPIKLRKSNWKERNLDVKAKKEKERFGPYIKHK